MRWCSSLVVFVAIFASACASESEPTESATHGHDCEGRGEPVVLGMEKQSEGGLYRAVLVEASPLPPLVGENDWTVEVTTASGEPVVDEVIVNFGMEDHPSHNKSKQGVMTAPGVFEFPAILITMPGYWEFEFVAPPDEGMLFGFCLPAD